MKDLLSPLPKSAEFLAFWKIYPRKVARLAAERAYTTARRIASHDEIISGLMRYQFQPDPSKQPHATTWLNGGCWIVEDDTPPPTVIVPIASRPTNQSGAMEMVEAFDMDLITPVEEQFREKGPSHAYEATPGSRQSLGYEAGPPDGWWKSASE